MVRRFGGHAMAAGLSLAAEHYEGFRAAFEDATRASCDGALFERTVATDGPLAAAEITLSLVEACDQHVWGQGFPAPLFDQAFYVLEQRLIKDRHLKLVLELDGRRFNAIFFGRVEPLPREAQLAFRPTIDDYQGQRRLALTIEQCAN
jgi:single-stranded-DNA-specific exonuclease